MKWIGIWLLIFALFSCNGTGKSGNPISLPYFNDADFTPIWVQKSDPLYKRMHSIPGFSFVDQNNRGLSDKMVSGKIWVSNFFFTGCGDICPKMTENLKKVSEAFLKDSNMVIISHSVNPLVDKPITLKRYAIQKNITDPKWHFVTGNRNEIYTLARRGYFADTVNPTRINSQFLHTENIILVDKHRHIRGVYNGTLAIEVENLISQIKRLEQED
jgi:protein SCO1/2